MKYTSNRYSVFAGFLLFVLTVGVFVYASSPSVTVSSAVLPAFESQPSAQSSGLPIDMFGIPTGNGASASPQPDIDLNRCGPGIILGFGQVVYDQTDFMIKGLDEVTNLVIGRRHLSRRDQTKTLYNEVYSTGELTLETEYQWVDVSGSPDFSAVGAGNAGSYTVGDTFTATGTTPTWGTAKVQLANQLVDKHSPFGPSWAFNYNHTITRYGDDVIMESYGRRDRFTKVTGTANVWEGSVGRFGRLTYTALPAKYTLRMPHGTLLEFEADDSATGKPGHLTKVISPNTNNILQFSYKTADDSLPILKRRLDQIINSLGKNITFNYEDEDYTQGVSSIQDHSGRTFTYDYDTTGRLLSVTSPAVTSPNNINDFTGKKYEYQYLFDSTNDVLKYALKAVIFPNQVADSSKTPRYAWTYNENSQGTNNSINPYLGYVKSFTLGEGTFKYDYRALASFVGANNNKAVREITVEDRMGTETVYKTNPLGQVLLEDIKTRGLRSDSGLPSSFAKSFKYNDDGQLTQYDDPIGARTQYAYTNRRDLEDISNSTFPNATNPRSVEYPMTDVIYSPAKTRTSDQEQYIRHRTVYEPIYNKPFQIIDPRGLEVPAQGMTQTEINAQRNKFTTTNYYDYMEGLGSSKTTLASWLGITETALGTLLNKFNVIDTSTIPNTTNNINNDGKTDQLAGNLIKTELPDVTLPNESEFDQIKSDLNMLNIASEIFQYNDFGQLTLQKDARNNVTSYSYYNNSGSTSTTGGGYLEKIIKDTVAGDSITPVAQTITYQYGSNSRGVPSAITDPRGVTTTYTINELDQVASVIRADAAVTGLTAFDYETLTLYDANNNVVETRVENSDTLTDVTGAVNSTETAAGGWIINKNTFDILDQPTSIIEDAGDGNNGETSIETTYTYDKNQNLIEETRGDSTITLRDEYAKEIVNYDERDLIISRTVGVGEPEQATFEQVVDAVGNVIKYIDGEVANTSVNSTGIAGDVTEIIYDGYNRKQKVIDPVGDYLIFNYDSASNVISKKSYGDLDASSTSKVLLAQTNIDFDERNRATDIHRGLFHYDGKKVGNINDVDASSDGFASKNILYDSLDRKVAVLDEEKGLETYSFDGLFRVTKEVDEVGNIFEYTYDKNNNIIQVKETEKKDITDTNGVVFNTYRTYDSLNRMTRLTEPNNSETFYEYDSRGNIIKIIDANLNEVEMTYDRANRLVQKDVFLSSNGMDAKRSNADTTQCGDGKITTQYVWDKLNRVISEINDKNTPVNYVYDDLNRIEKITYVDNTNEQWTFNDDNEIIQYIDRNGTKISRTYDASSRLIAETYVDDSNTLERGGTTQRTWEYDGQDRIVKSFDNNDPSITSDDVTYLYVYDSLNRVLRETQRIGLDASNDLNVDIEWEGADNNRKISTLYPNGFEVERSYDNLDRQVEINKNDDERTELIASFVYEGPNRIAGTTYGNGTILTKTYDSNRRAAEIKWENSTDTVVHYENTFNKVNRQVTENRLHLGNGKSYDSYTYDSANRMTGFLQDATFDGTNVVSNTGISSNRSLDGSNMMTSFLNKGENVSISVDGADSQGNSSLPKLNRYTAFGGKLRVYDNNGNLDDQNTVEDTPDDLEFVQDYKNQISSVRQNDTTTVVSRFAYDAKGRLILETIDSKIIRYVYDDNDLIEERELSNNDKILRQYVNGRANKEYIQMNDYSINDEPDNYYYHNNNQGSVGAITDSDGNVVEYYEYDWFGKRKIIEGFGESISEEPNLTKQLELDESEFSIYSIVDESSL